MSFCNIDWFVRSFARASVSSSFPSFSLFDVLSHSPSACYFFACGCCFQFFPVGSACLERVSNFVLVLSRECHTFCIRRFVMLFRPEIDLDALQCFWPDIAFCSDFDCNALSFHFHRTKNIMLQLHCCCMCARVCKRCSRKRFYICVAHSWFLRIFRTLCSIPREMHKTYNR